MANEAAEAKAGFEARNYHNTCEECKQTSHQRNHTFGYLPQPSSGVTVVQWYRSVFEKGAAASAFLGGTLLSITISTLDTKFEHVRHTAATGATLFLILFLLCLGLPLLFEFQGAAIVHALDDWSKRTVSSFLVHGLLALLSLTLQGLSLAGTACVFRVMEPYVPGASKAGFRVTIALAILVILAWVFQLGVWASEWRKEGRTPNANGTTLVQQQLSPSGD